MLLLLKKLMQITIMKVTITNKSSYSEKLKKGIHLGAFFSFYLSKVSRIPL
jgi:hypothetical protein